MIEVQTVPIVDLNVFGGCWVTERGYSKQLPPCLGLVPIETRPVAHNPKSGCGNIAQNSTSDLHRIF